jgi:hypothetical protein
MGVSQLSRCPFPFLAPPFSSATPAENPTKNLVAAAVEYYYVQ